MDISNGGKTKNFFRSVLEIWKRKKPSPFNWCTLLNVLTSGSIGEIALAENIVEELRKKYQGTGIYLTFVYCTQLTLNSVIMGVVKFHSLTHC